MVSLGVHPQVTGPAPESADSGVLRYPPTGSQAQQ